MMRGQISIDFVLSIIIFIVITGFVYTAVNSFDLSLESNMIHMKNHYNSIKLIENNESYDRVFYDQYYSDYNIVVTLPAKDCNVSIPSTVILNSDCYSYMVRK